ncbi:vWA domain-containing protein [Ruminococcus sp.]|uniref:vWA domain-containing protein n=1 Tax=Ruminococcus sp. TaxID=41978 RepID=UPI00388E3DEE
MKIKKINPKNVKVKKSENNTTELVFILDRSGSMGGLEQDTIGGFNAMIEKQKKQEGACFVTTVLFDHEVSTLHDRVPLSEIQPMTHEDYYVRGCTALIDAIGMTVRHIEEVHRYIRREDVPAHTMFVITTDGLENASREYSADRVRRMIEEKKRDGWEFLFIGANIDAVETAKHFGIGADRAVNYHADHKGTSVLFNCVSKAVSAARTCAPMQADWSREIEEDYESRKQG